MKKNLNIINYIKKYQLDTLIGTLIFMLEHEVCTEEELNHILKPIEKDLLYQEYLYNNMLRINKNKLGRALMLIEFDLFKKLTKQVHS